MRDKQYIIKRPGSPFWYIKLPGRSACSTGLRWKGAGLTERDLNENITKAVRIRDGAQRGEPDMLKLLGLDHVASGEPAAPQLPTLGEWLDVCEETGIRELSEKTIAAGLHRVAYWRGLWGDRVMAALDTGTGVAWRAAFLAGKDATITMSRNPKTRRAAGRLSNTAANTNAYLIEIKAIMGKAIGLRAVRDSETGRYRLPKPSDDLNKAVWWLPDPLDPRRPASFLDFNVGRLETEKVAAFKHYTDEQLARLIPAACDVDRSFGALLLLGCMTGQRLSALINVRRSAIIAAIPQGPNDPTVASIAFPGGDQKNGEPHMMGLTADVLDALRESDIDPELPEYFFARFKRVQPQSVSGCLSNFMKQACKAADVPYLRFHWATRATAAWALHNQGCTTLEIMQLLNWESEAMVRRYVPAMPLNLRAKGAKILGRIGTEAQPGTDSASA